jgi:hypothetical protein
LRSHSLAGAVGVDEGIAGDGADNIPEEYLEDCVDPLGAATYQYFWITAISG